jgi:hypothetical protein
LLRSATGITGQLLPFPLCNQTVKKLKLPFTPSYRYSPSVTPAKWGKGSQPKTSDELDEQTPVQRHVAMTWAQRLKRVFNIDVETCRACGGTAKVIACIEDPVVIEKILSHLSEKASSTETTLLPESRAPPHAGLYD